MQESSAWRELSDRFNELARDINSDFDGDWTPTGGWLFIGVTNQSTVKSFIAAAKRGAVLLGCAPEKLSYSFWLDELKRYGPHYESTWVIGPGSHGEPGEYEQRGIIRRVRKASAECCQYLETRAIAADRKTFVPQQAARYPGALSRTMTLFVGSERSKHQSFLRDSGGRDVMLQERLSKPRSVSPRNV
jgi:hypothetical protein